MKTETEGAFPLDNSYNSELGLSKLEYAAIHICAGLSANPSFTHAESDDRIAEMAVSQAKALFSKLNQE